MLATYGDAALRAAFERGLAEQAIGAEYIARFLAIAITIPTPITGDSTSQLAGRSSLLEDSGYSS